MRKPFQWSVSRRMRQLGCMGISIPLLDITTAAQDHYVWGCTDRGISTGI